MHELDYVLYKIRVLTSQRMHFLQITNIDIIPENTTVYSDHYTKYIDSPCGHKAYFSNLKVSDVYKDYLCLQFQSQCNRIPENAVG
jgi:hypothetical protein